VGKGHIDYKTKDDFCAVMKKLYGVNKKDAEKNVDMFFGTLGYFIENKYDLQFRGHLIINIKKVGERKHKNGFNPEKPETVKPAYLKAVARIMENLQKRVPKLS
jgi:nucleoid DNA-binding protein